MRFQGIVLLFSISIFAVAIDAGRADAQQMRIGVYGEPIQECDFGLAAPATVGEAHVIVTNSVDFRRVRLKASVPACNGIVFLGETVPGGVYLGNSQTGIEILRTMCTTSSDVEILTIQYLVTGSGTEVCEWVVEPYPGDAAIKIEDCDGFVATGAGNGSGQINNSGGCGLVGENNEIGAYRPYPADGASGVATDVQFDWVGPANYIYLADHSFESVITGHNHELDDLVFAPTFPGGPFVPPKPFDPGPLAPNTTYHWKMEAVNLGSYHGHYGWSDRWSFTTADVISTEKSTWGQIKALYR